MSKKNISIIILFILALIVFVVGIYLLFIKKPNTQEPTTNVPQFPQAPSNPSTQPTGTEGETPTTSSETPALVPVLNRLSLAPTAGATVYDLRMGTSTSSTTPIVRYTDRATAHTYEISPDAVGRTRTTATTIAQIQEALWANNSVILRRINSISDSIQNQIGRLATSTTASSSLSTAIIPSQMTTVTLSPKKDKMFFVTPGEDTSGTGVIAQSNASNPKELFSSPVNEWTATWPKESTLTLTTKPGSAVAGYLYFVNTTTGAFSKILGGITGLTTNTSSSTRFIAYTDTSTEYPVTQIFDTVTNTTSDLQIPTLSEKCVWSLENQNIIYCAVPTSIGAGKYPDIWYQGKTFFTDQIYKINIADESTTLLYNISETEPIDATNLFLDSKEDYLMFTNKQDYFLWSLRIKDLQ